jgi:hypothetical protein
MRFLQLHLGIAAVLMLTAFLLGHSEGSAALTALLGMLIGTIGFAAAGMPVFRLLNAPLAVFLFCVAVFSTDSSMLARGANALIAALVLALSVIPGRAWGGTPQPNP